MASTSFHVDVDPLALEEELCVCNCVVCSISKTAFSTYKHAKQLEIIEDGRPKPTLTKLQTKIKTCTRYFNVEMYEQYEWLTGCEKICKLFCWSCLLFSEEKHVFNKNGYSDLNNIHRIIKRHSISQAHLRAAIKEKTFGRFSTRHVNDDQLKMSHHKHNQLVERNRSILKRFIDVACFLGEHELGSGGNAECGTSTNGSFVELINLLSNYDDALKVHLEQSNILLERTDEIQSGLIAAVATVMFEKIKSEIEKARFVAIVFEETTDTIKIQLSAVVRYVTTDGNIQERFLGFLDIAADRKIDSVHTTVCDFVANIEASKKFIAQSYDGAVVRAGELRNLQTKVKENFPNALLVHCFAHPLNVVLAQSVAHIKECRIFFSCLIGFADFFSKSTQRKQMLDLIIQSKFPEVSPTQWIYNGRLVQTVYEHRRALIELFENILEACRDWDDETLHSSKVYLDNLKTDFDFNFLLNVFSEIFAFSDSLSDILQNDSNDIGLVVGKVGELKYMIHKARSDFDRFWENTIDMEDSEPQRKRTRTEDVKERKTSYHVKLLSRIMNEMSEQINCRLSGLDSFRFLELCNFTNFKNSSFPESSFKSLIELYGRYFDSVALHSELTVLYAADEVNTKHNATELLGFLKETELDKVYVEVVKLCELVLTIPATGAASRGGFSVLKRIRSFASGRTGEDIHSASVLSIEKDLVKEMTEHPCFYDDVIDEFAKGDTGIELHFK